MKSNIEQNCLWRRLDVLREDSKKDLQEDPNDQLSARFVECVNAFEKEGINLKEWFFSEVPCEDIIIFWHYPNGKTAKDADCEVEFLYYSGKCVPGFCDGSDDIETGSVREAIERCYASHRN